MASILKIGERWRAQVRRVGAKSISKTFKNHAAAEAWARALEHKVDSGQKIISNKATIDVLLRQYREAREEAGRAIAKQTNEHYMLRRLETYFAGRKLALLDTQEIVGYARARRRAGVAGYTVNMELSKLATALRYICALLNLPFNDPVATARPVLRHFKLTSAQNKRARRPSADEWAKLLAHFKKEEAASQRGVPMADIIELAALIGLRRGEIVRIVWGDLDQEQRVLMVRDRKDPRHKEGNDELVPLVGGALDIIMRQPRPANDAADQRIFPYNAQTLSKMFTGACQALQIIDLHFHDLRHEATSALFEAGWDIPEVAAVTGHKSWTNLRTYTQLNPVEIAKKNR